MEEFGRFNREHLSKIKEGLILFNKGHYWECHEELEHWWLEDTTDNARLIYWAVIQAANTCYHAEANNLSGAQGQLKKAKEKIKRAEDLGVETSLLLKHLSWNKFKKTVRSIPENATREDINVLIEFKFNDFPFDKIKSAVYVEEDEE